jgi:hypothetical protein
MEKIASSPGGFRRALLALSVPALCVACTQARVDYASVPSAGPGQEDLTDFRDPGIRFRIPRSLIMISVPAPPANPAPAAPPGGAGGGAPVAHAAAPVASPAFKSEVIDPVATGTTPMPFPHNPNYSYTVDLVPDTAGVVSLNDFFAKVAVGDQQILPAPQCVQARINIIGTTDVNLQATAVPSEFEIPADPHTVSTTISPLYTMHPRNDVFSTTTLQVTYLGDTKIMQSVGSTVTDNTQTVIKAVASVATAAAGAAVLLGAPLGAPPQPRSIATLTVTAADNRWVQPVMIPTSGTVTFNACGANITTKTDATPVAIGALNDITDILNAAKSLNVSKSK